MLMMMRDPGLIAVFVLDRTGHWLIHKKMNKMRYTFGKRKIHKAAARPQSTYQADPMTAQMQWNKIKHLR